MSIHQTPETKRERRERAREERREREAAETAAALRRKRLGQLGGLALAAAAVVVVLVVVFASGGQTKSKVPTAKGEAAPAANYVNQLFAGIPEQGLALGNPKAPVTLDEFADLQCPFCRDYSQKALPDLITRYVRTGKLRMVFHNLSFIGPDSRTGGLAAQAAAQQNRLWPFVELWYENQGTENSGYVSDAFTTKLAGAVGVNVPQLLNARNSPQSQAALDQADSLAAAHSITSTPSFLLGRSGGTPSPLAPSTLTTSSFTGPIDQAIKRAGG